MMSNTSKPAPGGQSAGPYHVVVLMGGNSGEREISLQSGAAVCQALASLGHRVTAVDPAETDLQAYDWANVDVCFLALHGTFGEDGQVQSLLEATGVPYTGSGRHASQLAFHKSAAKERFFQAHVPTPAYTLIHRGDSAERIDQLVRSFGFPLVVKPDAQGSSLGVTIVRTPEELPAALAACFCHDSFGLIEEYVDGSEWTLGIIDEEVLPLIQVQSGRDFYDYQAKYQDDATQYCFDFDLPTNVIQQLISTGQDAARALGTSGIVRVDIRLDAQQRPWVLEVNTIPGLTDHSLVPKAAARIGLGMPELCQRAIVSCLEKFAEDAQATARVQSATRAQEARAQEMRPR